MGFVYGITGCGHGCFLWEKWLPSSQAGIYAIGDCCYYDGKIDLIATGLGEAPTAVNNAINYIYPQQKVQPKHSTSL